MATSKTIDVSLTVAALMDMGRAFDDAMRSITADALHEVQLMGALYAPAGSIGNTTNPPGDLKRSISKEGPEGGHGVYAGRVGPTIVYGRQRALGGPIIPKHGLWLVFTKFGDTVYTHHVVQGPHPYMSPARKQAIPQIRDTEMDHLRRVIVTPRR